MEIRDRIRTYIVEQAGWDGPAASLTDDYQLIGNRVLDSLGMMNLITFAEDEFGIEIDDEELVPEHFSSVSSIVALLEPKLGVAR